MTGRSGRWCRRSTGSRIDATTEEEIAAQIAENEAEAMRDAAAYARRVRRRVGLSQVAFARRIGVPVDTVRNRDQGKPAPQGPARALPRIIAGPCSFDGSTMASTPLLATASDRHLFLPADTGTDSHGRMDQPKNPLTAED